MTTRFIYLPENPQEAPKEYGQDIKRTRKKAMLTIKLIITIINFCDTLVKAAIKYGPQWFL